MDDINYYFLLFGVIFIILIIIGIKDGYKKITRKKQVQLKDNQALCGIVCKYLSGIDHIIEGKHCYIYANEEKIKIITKENIPITINLELSKIRIFDMIERDKTEPHMIGFAIVNQHVPDKFIIIRYVNDKDENKEIYFSLIDEAKYRLDNEAFNSICNIFDYVNARIPKQETIIDL